MVQSSKQDKKVVRRYVSMGFQTIDGQPAYVHGRGVLSPSGKPLHNVEARLFEAFSGYGFPDPSTDTGKRTENLKAPVYLLRLSKSNPALGPILLGSAVRAVLSEFHPTIVTPLLIGQSGVGKSEMLGLVTSFFRSGTDVNSLPFNMVSTPRALRLLAQQSAHALFPVDDYYPTPGKRSDSDDFVEMLIFGGSTTAARATAKSPTELATGEPIRTLAMLTAEVALATDKESRHARALYCEVRKNDVYAKYRTACLKHARNGNFARAMREFIVACLSRYDLLKESVPERFEYYQREAEQALPDLHPRHWANIADIMLGIHFYLCFCRGEQVIRRATHRHLRQRSWEALVRLAKRQQNLIRRYSKDGIVGRAFENLLQGGKYHLLQFDTKDRPKGVPANRAGWVDGQWQGELLGYVDAAARTIYVPAHIDAQQLYDAFPRDAQALLARGPKQFWKRVAEHGLLRLTEDGRNATRVSQLDSRRYYVLSIPNLFR